MELIDGKKLAAARRATLYEAIKASGITPGLASIFVGNDAASRLYLKLKAKACEEVGIRFERLDFAADTDETTVRAAIEGLNKREDIHGILIQLPLPATLDEDTLISAMDPVKDVDGFHPVNLDALERGRNAIIPVLVRVVSAILQYTSFEISKKSMIVLGNSPVFLRPFLPYFRARGITVITAQTATALQTRMADIVVTAIGKPSTITGDFIKEGAIVIDIGSTPTPDGVKGDVDAASVAPKASWLTPVPGGVGPLTVAVLLENVARAAGVPI